VHALAALGREERHDVVADRERRDALADRLDDPAPSWPRTVGA
jgi:hypothetical protein